LARIALPHKALKEVVVGQILFHKNREKLVEKLGSNWANEGKLRLSGAMIKKHTKKILLINKTLLSYYGSNGKYLKTL
jgi:hypothetical protein